MNLLAMFVAAVSFWGQGNLPRCGTPTMKVSALVQYDGLADSTNCIAYIDREAASMWYAKHWQCAVVFHEVGHLYGQSHRKRGVMATPPTSPPACDRMLKKAGVDPLG